MTKSRRIVAVLVCAGAVAALIRALEQMNSPAPTLLWGQLMNFGHVPLFAVLASCVLGLTLGLLGEGMPRHRVYAVALAWSLALAGASEVVQVLDRRNVEVLDFLRNAAGTVGALALWASLDPNLGASAAWPRWRKLLRLLPVAVTLVALVPVGLTVESYRRMERRFPVLFRFDSAFELPFVREYNASLRLVPAPAGWSGFEDRRVGHLIFHPARYPTLSIFELHRDWGGFDRLEWDLFLVAGQEIDVILRVDDLKTDGRYKDRFNVKQPLRPGPNRLLISLEEIRNAPEARQMELRAIKSVMLFVSRPESPVSLYVADLKLVRVEEEPR